MRLRRGSRRRVGIRTSIRARLLHVLVQARDVELTALRGEVEAEVVARETEESPASMEPANDRVDSCDERGRAETRELVDRAREHAVVLVAAHRLERHAALDRLGADRHRTEKGVELPAADIGE